MSIGILGAGNLGRLVQNILRENDRQIVGFYDDDIEEGREINGSVVRGPIDGIHRNDDVSAAIIAIGDVTDRRRIAEDLRAKNVPLTSAVHPSAEIADSATVGAGTIVKESAVIEVAARIGENCIVGNNSVVCHDTVVEADTRLAPAVTIAGEARIGAGSYLAVDVSVDRGIEVGKEVTVASGCTVWEDVPAGATVKLPTRMDIHE